MMNGRSTRLALVAGLLAAGVHVCGRAAAAPEPLKPVGEAKGIHPGRVVWVHDPEATDWEGPGHGHWWEAAHTSRERVDAMLSRALRELTGAADDRAAWDALFRHLNRARGRGDVGYRAGERLAMKVNFVGFIWREGGVNESTYEHQARTDYMNTSPQLILALLRQLTEVVGVQQADIALADTLAYLANDYYEILHGQFPGVQYIDYAGKFGRVKATASKVPIYWSCRPQGFEQDHVADCFADADYLINVANLKAHTASGVTLCAKNHCGSLGRWMVQEGYFDMHPSLFAKQEKVYRILVDLMGHAHLGGKTVLYLIDGLYPGVHPKDPAPSRWRSAPFDGDWASSLLASQDPVAIDSVGYDFLWTEWEDYPRQPGVDDYLQEAALAADPPSGTFYDPDHASPVRRLPSQGVHEHWNNAEEKKYSRNLGTGDGIELIAVSGAER